MDYTLNRKIEALNNNVSQKRKALANHLMKSQSRRNDYNIVKKPTTTKPQVSSSSINLKSVGRDFEKFAKSSLNNDEIGMQTAITTYDSTKTVIVGSKKLNAVSNRLIDGSAKVTNNTIDIAGKTYKIAENIYAGYKTGTLKGTLNMYKNMSVNKVATSIKYSKPVYFVRNVIDGQQKLYLKASYRVSKDITFVKGVANGNIKITPKMINEYASKKMLNTARGSWSVAKTTYSTANRFAKSKVTRSSLNGLNNSIKSLGGKSDNVGLQALGTTTDTFKYSYKAGNATIRGIKKTAKTTDKAVKTVGKGAYKTARGTYSFLKSAKKIGVKKTSKIWYNAHLKGAGKKVTEKIGDALIKVLGSLIKNPIVLGAVAMLLCVVVISNTAIVTATSTVGGVIEFFEELAEGLEEAIETVVDAIGDFLDQCAEWIKGAWNWLTGNDEEEEVEIEIDIDIGDNLSICDYLLGTVQVYKAELGLKLEQRRNELIEDEGYHDVLFYNYRDETIEIHDIYDEDKGLMSDTQYVIAEYPVWKAVILGRIGTNFTGSEANTVAKSCFDVLTYKKEEPYVDINGDGIADYVYCDGQTSLSEGEHQCVIKIGNNWVSGLDMHETGTCYNCTGTLYHESHNTDGIECCVTYYWCDGHYRYTCKGHSNTSYCDDTTISSCTNKSENTSYCDLSDCTNKSYDGRKFSCNGHTETTYCSSDEMYYCTNKNYNGREFYCNGHTETTYCDLSACETKVEVCDSDGNVIKYDCGGHTEVRCNGHTEVSYCWDGYSDDYGECTDYNSYYYKCYYGNRSTPQNCTNEKSMFYCKGYTLCKGHKLMKFVLGSNGFDYLIAYCFTNRIEELEAKDDLTDEERQELSQLQMYYEYAEGCWENSDPILDEWLEMQNQQ